MQKIAVYTTIYPGGESFLPDWYRSVQEQTDQDFQLWVGLDQIKPSEVECAIGAPLGAVWVSATPRSTPAQIREQCLARMVNGFEAVILVDSDDILHPTRVAAARAALQDSEVTACALRLVDHQRQDLGKTLTLPRDMEPDEILPRNNVFGFSNSAYRSELLRKCLPLPVESVLIDWFVATKAWLLGASLSFDRVVRMDYRQHGANTAGIRFPFSASQIVRSTARVREHYRMLQDSSMENVLPERWEELQEAATDAELFWERVVSQPEILENYVSNLNTLEPQTIWWWEVAQPELQRFWKEHAGDPYETCRN
jgi:hypothetical protein